MTRAEPTKPKRKPVTDRMKVAALFYWNHIPCAECGIGIDPDDDVEWDHRHALTFLGEHAEWNVRPLHVSCHKKKTERDVKALAKVKRLEREKNGLPKRKRPKRAWGKRRLAHG